MHDFRSITLASGATLTTLPGDRIAVTIPDDDRIPVIDGIGKDHGASTAWPTDAEIAEGAAKLYGRPVTIGDWHEGDTILETVYDVREAEPVRIHVTLSADGFGDDATDDDRYSFRAYVEERVEAMHPGSVCTTEIANVLRTTVTAPISIDAGELAALVGNELWEEWCSGSRAASESAS